MFRVGARFGIAFFFVLGVAVGQVSPADFTKAEGLRDEWTYLTKNVADPARWIGDTSQFLYRKTVPGGFKFVVMDAKTLEKRPAFDQERMAAALTKSSGTTYTALRRGRVQRRQDRRDVSFLGKSMEMQTH